MNLDTFPIGFLLAATVVLMILAFEAGHKLGHAALRHAKQENESTVSTIAGAILGLVAFILAFTFGIVADRYDARKALVRDEANAIRTAWLRSDFLPEVADRVEATTLFRKYVDFRLAAVQSGDLDQVYKALAESARIQRRLWDMAVVNARKDMNSDVSALYLESLNEVIGIQALRVAVGLQARIPGGIWLVLTALVILGLMGVGFQTAIAGSRRSWALPVLAFAFSLVIALIASLDRPQGRFITVSQQPLVDLQSSMAAGVKVNSDNVEKP